MFRALVFDLDDTLYVEKDFVRSGYKAVARHLADFGICPCECAFASMVDTLETQGRQRVFPVLLEKFPDAGLSIPELVEVYRRHIPSIAMNPGYPELLRQFRLTYKLGVITDGLPEVQERKVRALGLGRVMDKIIYTWEYGPERQKPHPLSFSLMLECLGVEPAATLFVGDDSEKDCRGAHGVGMKAAQVRNGLSRGGQFIAADQETPEFVIETLCELPQILQQTN